MGTYHQTYTLGNETLPYCFSLGTLLKLFLPWLTHPYILGEPLELLLEA